MKDMKRTFFEYLGIADMEKIHSQIIQWILSSNNESISENGKNEIISMLFGIQDFKIKEIITEYKNIDIVIKSETSIICIENKLKSSQHSNQLKNYQKSIEKQYGDIKTYFYFLTLIGEESDETEWRNITYNSLLKVLTKIKKQENKDGLILEEYIQTLNNFQHVINDFLKFPENYMNVFQDGSKTKSQKIKELKTPKQRFISENQLETIFQKLYFKKVAQKLNLDKENYYITETHGNAIFGVIIDRFEIKDHKLNFGLDFQNGTFKTFCISSDYNNSKPDLIPIEISTLLEQLKGNEKYGYHRFNKPRTKAQYSLTKRKFNFAGIKINEFADRYSKELDLSKELISNELIKKLANNL